MRINQIGKVCAASLKFIRQWKQYLQKQTFHVTFTLRAETCTEMPGTDAKFDEKQVLYVEV
jgi:hypothetical protein